MKSFSDRHGYQGTGAPITIREDAPDDVRFAVAEIARGVGLRPKQIRAIVCGALLIAPDPNNWSDYPNIWDEVLKLLNECEWFKVYDIAEALWRSLQDESQDAFQQRINKLFFERGIGWEIRAPDGIIFRGGEAFGKVTSDASAVLYASGRSVAANEIHEALRDISRRPTPDITGAIQHAVAALECTARDVVGERGATLGALLPKLALPKPLDSAVEKLWGFASDRARHLREGETVGNEEAELVVSVACAVCTFLAQRADA